MKQTFSVLHSGAWFDNEAKCVRAVYRIRFVVTFCHDYVGFRCAQKT